MTPQYGRAVIQTGVGTVEISAAATKGVIMGVSYTGGGTCVIEDAAGAVVLCYVATPGIVAPFKFENGARINVGTGGNATAFWYPLR